MVIQLILQVLITAVSILFFWLPPVLNLPIFMGFDIDGALVSGMGAFYRYATVVWPVYVAFQGFLALTGYYAIKMVVRFFLGHRTPGKQ